MLHKVTPEGGIKVELKPAEPLEVYDVEEMRAELDRLEQGDDELTLYVNCATLMSSPKTMLVMFVTMSVAHPMLRRNVRFLSCAGRGACQRCLRQSPWTLR